MITSHIEGLGALILVLDQYDATIGDNEMMSDSPTLDTPEREDGNFMVLEHLETMTAISWLLS